MIKTIIFDLGGVVLSPVMDRAVLKYASQYLDLPPEKIKKGFKDYVKNLCSGELNVREFWNKIAIDNNKILPENYKDFFTVPYKKSFNKNDEVLDYIKILKENNIQIVCLSNTIKEHVDILKKDDIFDFFDELFFSNELKYSKPDKNIYLHVIKKLNILPNETIFIDDSENNIKTAKEIGINVILAITPNQIVESIKSITGIK